MVKVKVLEKIIMADEQLQRKLRKNSRWRRSLNCNVSDFTRKMIMFADIYVGTW